MYRFLRRCAAVLLILIPSISLAATYQAGKDYEIIQGATPMKGQKVLVQEFFSYACPGCYQIEPTIQKWIAQKPAYVNFERVPVVFRPAWEPYAKAYYTAKSLGVEAKMDSVLFKSVQNGRRLSTSEEMAQIFAENGVKKQDFESIYDFTPGMTTRLNNGMRLMQTYQIREVPVVIINGYYKLTRSMAQNDDRFLDILNFLVNKANAS